MSSNYSYSSPPSSPLASFFPTGPASPHAFASFHQSPRDRHAMYAALAPSSQANVPAGGQAGMGTMKKFIQRK
ncbi:hypothetical protein FOMPIDRAFT_1022363 [Fomitopsis schrenkii]|uniref:Uncharacterized protein n=1 Tax=Fomitopsis schrenkii TaxID=2126942 RepID=S8FYR1_FOMSC|nr:hypothetical protein FOMPIDRAFT_1022363 [Fomitopsis schrenkii]